MLKKFLLWPVSLAIGFANGLFGAGGGLILVVMLKKFFNLDEKKSHATTTAIILPLCILSSLIMAQRHAPNWSMSLFISLGGLFGGAIGAKILTKISNRWLKKIFSVAIIISAVKIIL